MRNILVILCIVGLAAAGVIIDRPRLNLNVVQGSQNGIGRLYTMSRDELLRQKFILDILRQVELPLEDRLLLEINIDGVTDENMYIGPLDDDMLMVLDLIRNNRILDRNVLCSYTNEMHIRQLLGLYRLFVRCRDFQRLQKLAVYARRYINPVLFVNALTLALQDRADTEMLIVPALYEILPRYYLDDSVIRTVENLERDTNQIGTVAKNDVSLRPSLFDLTQLRRNAKLNFNPFVGGNGVGIFDKSQLWMPWRDLHQQLAMQKAAALGGNRLIMFDKNKENMSLRIIPMGNSQGHLSEDIGLRSFLNILLDELVVEQSRTLKNLDRDVITNEEQDLGRRSTFLNRERNILDRVEPVRRYEDEDVMFKNRDRVESLRRDDITLNRGDMNLPFRRDMDVRETRRDNDIRMNQDIPIRRLDNDDDELMRKNRGYVGSNRLNLLNGKKGYEGILNRDINEDVGVNRNLGIERNFDVNRRLNIDGDDELTRLNREHVGSTKLGLLYGKRGILNRDTNTKYDVNRVQRDRNLEIERDFQANRFLGMKRNFGMDRNIDVQNRERDEDLLLKRNLDIDRNVDLNRNLRVDREDNVMYRRNYDNDLPTTSVDDDRLLHVSGKRLNLLNSKTRNVPLNEIMQGERTDEVRRMPRSIDRTTGDDRRQRMGQLILYHLQQLVARLNVEHISQQQNVGRVSLLKNTNNVDVRENLGHSVVDNVRDQILTRQRTIQGSNTIVDVMRGIGQINRMDNLNFDMNRIQGGRLDNFDLTMLEDFHLDERTRSVVIEKMQEISKRLETTLEQTITHLSERQLHYSKLGLDDEIIIREIDRLILNEILQEIVNLSEYVEGGQISKILETPITQLLLRYTINTIERQIQQLRRPRNLDEIAFDGVTINNVKVDDFRTYVEEVDVDLTNLLNTMDGGLEKSQRTVIGRMPRLNHKSFAINLDLTSQRNQRVVVRTLMVPKFDALGRVMTPEEQRRNALLLDIVDVDLTTGRNVIKRKSRDITWTGRDVTTYSELYERVMRAMQGNVDLTMNPLFGQTTLLPHRLLIPRGRVEGLAMQLLVIITPVDDNIQATRIISDERRRDVNTRFGFDSLLLDDLPLIYPMDRDLIDFQKLLNLPNVSIKDILIYHEDKVKRLPQ
ncbi:fat-body protein 1-like [Musca autumnalis]|uniref:fat-body protein 1-like n=1 Tax=Musca autumnalis TaxID=221902 RepID=UPI003CF8154F